MRRQKANRGPSRAFNDGQEPEAAWVPCESESLGSTGITEIAIEETSCYGYCPTYTMILRSDGSVTYTGQANVKFKGTRKGHLDPALFDQLARLVDDLGFFGLDDFYACAVTNQSTTYLSVVRNGQRKTIKHYAPELSGPARLRWLESWLSLVADAVDWE